MSMAAACSWNDSAGPILSRPIAGWRVWKPVAAPYLEEYRRYAALRDDAGKASASDAADILVRIEQAKSQLPAGDPLIGRLDALSRSLKLD